MNRACVCAEWETVATEAVALPFVVSGVIYWPVGTASALGYGKTWDAAQVPQSASSLGSNVRAVIRRPDGTEQVARVGTIAEGMYGLDRISSTTLRVFRSEGVGVFSSPDHDLPDVGSDWILIWVNPAVTVATSYAGEKTVDWSFGPRCSSPISCPDGRASGVQVMEVSPRLIRGEVTWSPYHDAFLATLDPEERVALIAFDPRAAGAAIAGPRYQLGLADFHVDGTVDASEVSWQPCADPDAFEVLAETSVAMSDGDTFVLQYGVQHDAICEEQKPGLLAGTTTPGCDIRGRVFVDRLSGTLVMEPSTSSAACSRP